MMRCSLPLCLALAASEPDADGGDESVLLS